jgi:hypothetical protein
MPLVCLVWTLRAGRPWGGWGVMLCAVCCLSCPYAFRTQPLAQPTCAAGKGNIGSGGGTEEGSPHADGVSVLHLPVCKADSCMPCLPFEGFNTCYKNLRTRHVKDASLAQSRQAGGCLPNLPIVALPPRCRHLAPALSLAPAVVVLSPPLQGPRQCRRRLNRPPSSPSRQLLSGS